MRKALFPVQTHNASLSLGASPSTSSRDAIGAYDFHPNVADRAPRPRPLLRLSGDWLIRESGLRAVSELRRRCRSARLRAAAFRTSTLTRWDSSLVAFVRTSRVRRSHGFDVDLSGLRLLSVDSGAGAG
jgi:hypothetical protein